MDIRLLLTTEPSPSYEDRAAARERAISSASSETTHSTSVGTVRRDATSVLKGLFDSGVSNHSGSRAASPIPVRPPRKRISNCEAPSCSTLASSKGKAREDAVAAIGSSFSYTPLPEDYCFRPPEFDFAAAQDYMDRSDTEEEESEPEEPETPPLDYMGLGTPIITPRLLAKVMQAKAAGQSLKLQNPNVLYKGSTGLVEKKSHKKKKDKDGQRKEKKSHKKKEGPKGGAAKSRGASGGRGDSLAPSTSSKGAGSKRSRSDFFDDDESNAEDARYGKKGPGGPKGWKGWALVEVSSDEEERKRLYDEEGRPIRQNGDLDDEETSTDSEAERLKQKPGWKGWALVKDPPDRSRLVRLDAPPLVLTTRSTRSGHTFGNENWDESVMGKKRGDSVGQLSRQGSRLSVSEQQNKLR